MMTVLRAAGEYAALKAAVDEAGYQAVSIR